MARPLPPRSREIPEPESPERSLAQHHRHEVEEELRRPEVQLPRSNFEHKAEHAPDQHTKAHRSLSGVPVHTLSQNGYGNAVVAVVAGVVLSFFSSCCCSVCCCCLFFEASFLSRTTRSLKIARRARARSLLRAAPACTIKIN